MQWQQQKAAAATTATTTTTVVFVVVLLNVGASFLVYIWPGGGTFHIHNA
jgi:hypothetical protein